MGDAKKDNPIDRGLVSKEEIFQDYILFVNGKGQAVYRLSREHVPKSVA